jgi:glycosyltransferase involved in cell wall biosynthesis
MTSVSIAMASYNGQKHILRQLDSLAAQTRVPDELVLCDDGSEDDTISIVESFARSAPFPVNIHRNDARLGYRANFMRAAGLCQSDLIAFSDQDDYWKPKKIAEGIKPFSDPDMLLSYHNADVVKSDGVHIGTLASRAASRPILLPLSSGPFWPYALGFSQVFRRSLLSLSDLWPKSRDVYDPDEPVGHDQWFFFLASVLGKIAYLEQRLVDYTQHEHNTYGWRPTSLRQSLLKHFRDRSDEYSQYARAARNREFILETLKTRFQNEWSNRAAAGADYYRKIAWLLERRNAVYTANNFSERIAAFHDVRNGGGYTSILGLGRKSLLADICFGVAMGRLLRSPATKVEK